MTYLSKILKMVSGREVGVVYVYLCYLIPKAVIVENVSRKTYWALN